MTGADLPNAFPYFIAIERLLAAGITPPTAVVVLWAYALVYCLPCLLLLVLGLSHGDRVTAGLRRLHARFGTVATIPPTPCEPPPSVRPDSPLPRSPSLSEQRLHWHVEACRQRPIIGWTR